MPVTTERKKNSIVWRWVIVGRKGSFFFSKQNPQIIAINLLEIERWSERAKTFVNQLRTVKENENWVTEGLGMEVPQEWQTGAWLGDTNTMIVKTTTPTRERTSGHETEGYVRQRQELFKLI
jgi:hypothetical protein